MTITVQDVVKELCKMGLEPTVAYSAERDMLYYDMNTQAKSQLWLFEDFHVEGRYDYTAQISPNQSLEDILIDLFWEFKGCIHGRDFYSHTWAEIGVKLGCVLKTTRTTVEYNL